MTNKDVIEKFDKLVGKDLTNDVIINRTEEMAGVKHEVTYSPAAASNYTTIRFDHIDVSIKRNDVGIISNVITRPYLDEEVRLKEKSCKK